MERVLSELRFPEQLTDDDVGQILTMLPNVLTHLVPDGTIQAVVITTYPGGMRICGWQIKPGGVYRVSCTYPDQTKEIFLAHVPGHGWLAQKPAYITNKS